MKWIGQHIYDLVARFRNDVYLEDLSTTTETNVLVVDSDGKVSKTTVITGDVTGVTAGSNITVTDPTGPVPTVALNTSLTGLDSVTSTSFVGALTGTASGNLVSGGALGTPSSGTLTNCTFPTLNQSTAGNAATATKIASITNDNIVQLDAIQALSNKTFTVGATFKGSTSGVTFLQATAVAGETTLTLPAATDTLVGKATTDTLTNKILGRPGIENYAAFIGDTSGATRLVATAVAGETVLTLPAATDTLVGKDTADILTNKTLTAPTITGAGAIAGVFTGNITGNVTGNADTATKIDTITNADIVQLTGVQTLTDKTLTSPVINTPTGIVKGDVGLGSVDNTADTAKPVSTAQRTALDLKANLASPTFTGKISLNDGGYSVFVGEGAGLNDDASANKNVGVGYQALRANTIGSFNTANGHEALYSNTTGDINTANGHEALYSNTTGSANTANGYAALGNATGSFNTAFGAAALSGNTTGINNIAVGSNAGMYITGDVTDNTVTDNSVFLGTNTKALADSQTNQIVIGYDATGLGSNTAILGNSSITKTRLQGGIEINASDTTITRAEAGRIAVEGVNVVTTSSTDTLENKTLTSPTLTTPIIADGAITTAMQKHLQTFEFNGYLLGTNTDYYFPSGISTNTGPFKHDKLGGADGTTAITTQSLIRMGGKVMPYSGTVKLWKGWGTGNIAGSVTIGIFKYTPSATTPPSTSSVALLPVASTTFTAIAGTASNNSVIGFSESIPVAGFSAGDILMTGIKGISGMDVYFTSTLEVEWD
jgi:hypothetical protein